MAQTMTMTLDAGDAHPVLRELEVLLPKLPQCFADVVQALLERGAAFAFHSDASTAAGTAHGRARLEATEGMLGLLAAARTWDRQGDVAG